jgi:UDP-N-acetylglucosamine 1-carboxyvinyltransferase
MSPRFVVDGGRPLRGTVRPAGNKNAALPMIAAALMGEGPSDLLNVPRIRDVEIQLELARRLGADVQWSGPNRVRIDPANLASRPLDADLCSRLRASILLAGPLLARFGRVTLPPPGGDVIGRRRLDTHFLAFERLGAEVDVGEHYQVTAPRLTGTEVFLDEPSVTATENALMAAVRAQGRTVLRNAAAEPHVQDLARTLILMGARIEGLGTNLLVVDGVERLTGGTFEVGPDHIEIGSFIGLAAVTNGDLRIEGVRAEDLHPILLQFDRLGVRPRLDGATLHVESSQERRVRPDLGGHVPKIEDGPWPAFPADLTSIAVVVATQCDGLVLIFEKMFESRLYFVDKLVGMGARAVLCDPHRVVVAGRSPLRGGVVESPDIRAGMAMLLAALAAEGRSTIHNIGQIDRGYERIDERLRGLGAQIERVES